MTTYRTAGINISKKFTASICSAEVGSSSNLLSHTRLRGVTTQNTASPGNPTYLLTHSMEHSSPWEANRFSASQEIPRILWNPKVHYRIHKCPSPIPSLSQLDPVLNPTSYFLKIHLILILPSRPRSPQWSLSLTFPHQNPVYASSLLHFITRKIFGEQYRPFSSSFCSFVHSPSSSIGLS